MDFYVLFFFGGSDSSMESDAFTLFKTNSSPLKIVVSNRDLQTSRGSPFSGAIFS